MDKCICDDCSSLVQSPQDPGEQKSNEITERSNFSFWVKFPFIAKMILYAKDLMNTPGSDLQTLLTKTNYTPPSGHIKQCI